MSREYLYTEEVIIPSKGKLNPEIPEGKITLRCVELRDQKYLSGSKLVNKNKSIALLERCIIAPENVNVSNLTQIDILFLLIKLRVLSYDSRYGYTAVCPACRKSFTVDADLSNMEVLPLEDGYEDKLVVKLPRRKDTVHVHITTEGDKEFVDSEVSRLKSKFKDLEEDPSITIELARAIDKIVLTKPNSEGLKELTDYIDILKYVESLTDYDAIAIDSAINSVNFGVNTLIPSTCTHCGETVHTMLKATPEFFRPRFVR